jgi:hypothetical protein
LLGLRKVLQLVPAIIAMKHLGAMSIAEANCKQQNYHQNVEHEARRIFHYHLIGESQGD